MGEVIHAWKSVSIIGKLELRTFNFVLVLCCTRKSEYYLKKLKLIFCLVLSKGLFLVYISVNITLKQFLIHSPVIIFGSHSLVVLAGYCRNSCHICRVITSLSIGLMLKNLVLQIYPRQDINSDLPGPQASMLPCDGPCLNKLKLLSNFLHSKWNFETYAINSHRLHWLHLDTHKGVFLNDVIQRGRYFCKSTQIDVSKIK